MRDTYSSLCTRTKLLSKSFCARALMLLFCCVVFAPAIYAQQQITVKGNVTDEAGEPIIGASIKSGSTGTISDLDGNFSLSVPSNATLHVTYLGYLSQDVRVEGKTSLLVVLKEDTQKLDEVVIVGYGTQRIKDLTGAAAPVPLDDIENLPGASLADALSGQILGLNVEKSSGRPGATGTFTVRQPAPAFASGGVGQDFGPLIVIDDVVQVDEYGNPTYDSFNMLDYSEVENMTVLKDASAAIYGSRSSQGVILVKTKRGRIGAPKISYSAKLDFSDAVSHIKTTSAYETGVFTNRMFNQIKANGGTDYTSYLYSTEELEAMRSLNYDWLDKAWSSSFSHRHSLTVNGGTDKLTYFAGITYQDQDSNLGSIQDHNRWTFRTGGEIKVTSGLKLSASVAGYNSKTIDVNDQAKITSGPWGSQSSSGDYSQLRHMPKYIPWQVSAINPATNQEETFWTSPWKGPHLLHTSSDIGSGYAAWNFFANEASNARKNKDDNGFNANFSLTYDVPFIKGLSLKGSYAVSYSNSLDIQVGDYYTLALAKNTNEAGAHLIGDHTIYDFVKYGKGSNNIPKVLYDKSTRKSEQVNLMLMYNRSFGKHDISLTGVIERAEAEGNSTKLTYQGPWDSYNGVSNSAGSLITAGADSYFKKTESGALSYIGRANYKYDNRYLAEFLIRSDASTKFAPENYWGTFMTGAAGWVISEENFYKNSKLSNYINYLKLRYSLGKTGKDNVKAWQWITTYSVDPSTGLGFGSIDGAPSFGAITNGRVNRDIKWDTTIKNNLGIDMNFLSNRLALTTDYFYDKTKDMLMLIPPADEPIYMGANTVVTNYGKVDAWGWEFSLRWNDQIKQSLLPSWGPIKYAVGMDYGISSYEIKLGKSAFFDYPGYINDQKDITGYRSPNNEYGMKVWKQTSKGDGMLRTQEDVDKYWQYLTDLATAAGGTPSYFGITSKDKMHVGMLAYQDLAGDLDAENKTIAGPNGVITNDHAQDYAKLANNRRHNINTRLKFDWGNFSWSAQLSTSWGGYHSIYSDVAQSVNNNQTMIMSQFSYIKDMFDPIDNPDGKYPSMAVANAYGMPSDFWQVSSFRCYVRNMTFGYSLPQKVLKNTGIDRLQFNLTGNNLWDFYNPYPDKFRNMYDDGRTGYPTLRTWTLGVNLTF